MVSSEATGFMVDADGKWQRMKVEYYDPSISPTIEGMMERKWREMRMRGIR